MRRERRTAHFPRRFDPAAISALWSKCRGRQGSGPFSNTDDMAVIGVLSTQLLHDRFVRRAPEAAPVTPVTPATLIDRATTRRDP